MSQSTMDPMVAVSSIDSTATLPQEGSHSLEFAEVFPKNLKTQTDSCGDSFFQSQVSPSYFASCTNESSTCYFASKLQPHSPLSGTNCLPSSRCSSNGSGNNSCNNSNSSSSSNNNNNNNVNGNSVNIPCNITLSVASADWTAQLSRCLNKLVNKMEAQRIQLMQLSSRLEPLIYNGTPTNGPNGSALGNESPKSTCAIKSHSIESQLVSNCTFTNDPMSPGGNNSNLGASLQYKERLEHLQDVLNQQWMELEFMKKSCSEYHGRMNLLKGSHSSPSHLQPGTVISSIESSHHHIHQHHNQLQNNCEATATSALLAYPPSTCTSSTAQLISSQVIHALSPTSPYGSTSGGNCSSFASKVNAVDCGKDTSPSKGEAKSHATTPVVSYIKSEGSSDSRDSGITSELSS